jgi:hypothetical protein
LVTGTNGTTLLIHRSQGGASPRSMSCGVAVMHLRPLRRAATLALAGALAFAGVASADVVRADGDILTPVTDSFVDLGDMAPSAEVTVTVGFTLVCAGLSHPDAGQTIQLGFLTGSQPLDGEIVSVGGASLGPVPAEWTADGEGCPDPVPSVATGGTSTVTLRAPSVPGNGYAFSIMWSRALSPEGSDDGNAFGRSSTSVTFAVNVVANTPPTVHVPDDTTVEGTTSGGWTAAFDVDATDAEDAPDPTPSCSPAVGDLLPLGTTTVTCTATDTGGLADTDTFDVTVVDTTAPGLALPADTTVSTADPDGASVAYGSPVVADIVDPNPTVGCLPASGSTLPIGATTVTCTATDHSGNSTSGTFHVTVEFAPTHTASAAWGEPVGGGGTFSANRGRNVPVKVTLAVDGAVRTRGTATLRLTPCGSDSPATTVALVYGGGRWNASLDTSSLGGSCYTVTATIDGLDAGHFTLELRGAEAAKAKPGK